MRAVLCAAPGRLEVVERQPPIAANGWIPVDIKAVGVCGTDFHIFEGTHPFLEYPRVMGHELSGLVGEGSASEALPAGTPVIVNPYLNCGHCIACRKGKPNCCTTLRVLGVHIDGGMCERIVVPEANLYPAAPLGLRDAAMVEFLAIGAHAVHRSEVKPGDRVLIVGAGPIGVGTAIFARATGADVTLVDVSERRLGYLSDKLGFTQSIRAGENSVAEASHATDGDLFDVVYDATGNARAMEHSFSFVAHGGTLVFVGVLKADITFSDGDFHRREMTLKATRNATRADFETVVRAIGGGLIPMDSINTHGAMLEDLPRAMPDWIASREHPLKAVLTV